MNDWTILYRLQEAGETDVIDAGRIPRTIEIHLFGDLVDGVTPGDLVTITGIVKVPLFSSVSSNRLLLSKNKPFSGIPPNQVYSYYTFKLIVYNIIKYTSRNMILRLGWLWF